MNTSRDTNSGSRTDVARQAGAGLCPFANRPMDDCYCKRLTSLHVADAVFYCTANYPICPIYKAKGNV